MPSPLPWTALALAGLALPRLDAGSPVAAPAPETAGVPAAQEPVPWFELQRRDAELSFTPRSDDEALARLTEAELSLPELRAALTTLGVTGLRSEVPRLESWALNGDRDTRIAALLALGQIGWADLDFLIERVETEAAPLAEAALAALLVSGEPRALEYVRAVRENLDHPLSTQADLLVRWRSEEDGGPETRMARAYYQNRYQAARRYGLIGGQAWDVIVLRELMEDEAFLDRVVFDSAGKLRPPGVRDHFLEILMSGPPPGPEDAYPGLRAALRAMPSEVSELVDASLWTPPGERAWRLLLDEIELRRLEGLTPGILREAFFEVPELETQASVLLVRAGLGEGIPRLELGLDSNDPKERARVAAAFGGTGSQRHLDLLLRVRDDPSPLVRAAALVARFRLGSPEAEDELRQRFEPTVVFDPDARERDPTEDLLVVQELCRLVNEPDVRQLLASLYHYFEQPAGLDVAVALTSVGRPEGRLAVRAAVKRGVPPGEEGARMLRALATDPSLEDLELLRRLFPVDGDRELNATLAQILIDRHDASILKVLTAALWREPWNRSCLAAALIIEVGNVDRLRAELQHPPAGVSRRDRRRVGFALGEFAGIQQVELLEERLSSNDPGLQGALLGALAARTH